MHAEMAERQVALSIERFIAARGWATPAGERAQ